MNNRQIKPQVKKDEKTCIRCKKDKPNGKYYLSRNDLIDNGSFGLCKDCIKEIINYNDAETIYSVLRFLNIPFLQSYWSKAESSNKDTFGDYIRMANSLPQNQKTNWDDLINKENGVSTDEIVYIREEINLSEDELRQLVNFWGKGFSKEDYLFLDNEYSNFITRYECDSYAMELLFQEASHQRLTIKKKREARESVDKELKTLQDLLGSANIKPAQETGANSTEQATFGTLLKKWENDKPVPEPLPEWMEGDWIRKYVLVWFFGHLCKILNIQNDYSAMYEKEIKKYTVDSDEDDKEESGD